MAKREVHNKANAGRERSALAGVLPEGLASPPRTPEELERYVHELFGVRLTRRALSEGSDATLAYMVHNFFEGTWVVTGGGEALPVAPGLIGADSVVWAARGTGKTFLGAVATALDLLYKPGVQVRVLGGSLEQSARMYEHLRALFADEPLRGALSARPTARGLGLINGSRVEVLAQSQASVRGTRVQKLRCDEVDLFDEGVWSAAQLTTRSREVAGPWGARVQGAVHASSTMHVPLGLMWRLVDGARRVDGAPEEPGGARPLRALFRWGVVDALERCAPQEDCARCELWAECRGRAKEHGQGHLPVADARALKRRVSAQVWASEMLCQRPRRSDCVFPEFDVALHVRPAAQLPGPAQVAGLADARRLDPLAPSLVAGMDFGVRAPTVVLWALAHADGRVEVLGEYVRVQATLAEHARAVKESAWGLPRVLCCDPAGHARNDQTGISSIIALRRAGLAATARRVGLVASIEGLRARLAPATGAPTLVISDACTELISSLTRYRYSPTDPGDERPLKDGADHAVDALRYLLAGLEAQDERARRYG
jgi:hypothetical protein